MVNLSNRINNIEHELQYYRAIKPVSGWYGSYKHSLVLAKIEGLSRQNCQLSIIRNTQKENVIAFMEANPSLSRAEVEKYAMNAVNVVLVENQHEVKYAKEYVTIALVLTGGYVGYKCITYVQPDAPQDQPEKSLMYQALKQLPGGAPPLEKNPEHLTLLEKISRIEL